MSIERVKSFFSGYGMEERIVEFDTSSATVELAAEALGCDGAHIAKSMTFDAGERTILVVCAGDTKVDNSKFKTEFGVKSKMLSPELLPERVGHAMGGVCPFAINEKAEVYLDVSLKRFDTVYPACGSSNSAIGLSIDELEKYSGFIKWVDVTKPKE